MVILGQLVLLTRHLTPQPIRTTIFLLSRNHLKKLLLIIFYHILIIFLFWALYLYQIGWWWMYFFIRIWKSLVEIYFLYLTIICISFIVIIIIRILVFLVMRFHSHLEYAFGCLNFSKAVFLIWLLFVLALITSIFIRLISNLLTFFKSFLFFNVLLITVRIAVLFVDE